MKFFKRLFCVHYYIKTSDRLGCMLYKWKCTKCGKEVYKDYMNSPINPIT